MGRNRHTVAGFREALRRILAVTKYPSNGIDKEIWNDVVETTRTVYQAILRPAGILIVLVWIAYQLVAAIKLHWLSTAPELHEQALFRYQQYRHQRERTSSSATNRWSLWARRKNRSRRRIEWLLKKAISQDPQYRPAYWSLAAWYLYDDDCLQAVPLNRNPNDFNFDPQKRLDQALKILLECQRACQGIDEHMLVLRFDADALRHNQHHMIPFQIRQDTYLSPTQCASKNRNNEKKNIMMESPARQNSTITSTESHKHMGKKSQ